MGKGTKPAVLLGLALLGSTVAIEGHCWGGGTDQTAPLPRFDTSHGWVDWHIDIQEETPRTTGNISIDRQEAQELRRCQQVREELAKKGKGRRLSCQVADD